MDEFGKKPERNPLRDKALEMIDIKRPLTGENLSEADSLRLIHELEVHQIELELQNEELVQAEIIARETTDKYVELYDFAPTGYLTFSPIGEILELNLAAAEMLERDRSSLLNRRFSFFVSLDTKSAFNSFLEEVFKQDFYKSELICIEGETISTKMVELIGKRDENGERCYVTVNDVTQQILADNEIHKSEEFQKILLDNIPVATLVIKKKSKEIVACNKLAADIGAVVGKTCFRTFGHSDNTCPYCKAPEMWKKDVPQIIETEFLDKIWEVHWVRFSDDLFIHYMYDITARKKAELEKQISWQKYQDLANFLPQIVFEIDLDGKLTYGNLQTFEVFGFSQEEFEKGIPVFNFLVPEDRERAKVNVTKKLVGRSAERNEYTALKKDGSTFPVLIYSRPIVKDGKNVGLSGAIVDITERKEDELKLLKSKEELSNILENTTNLFYAHKPDNQLVYLSPQSIYFLGCEPSEAMIRWTEFISDHPINEIGLKKTIKAIETGEKQPQYELELIKLDGTRIWVEVNEAPVVKNGKTEMIVGSLTDITKRINAEKLLKDSMERFDLAVNATRDGIFDWNLVNNEIYYSPAWKMMLGYKDNELPNDFSVWERLTDPVDIERSWEMQNDLINKKIDRFVLEFRMKHKDGHWVEILSEAQAVFDGDTALRIIGVHSDISKLREAERSAIKEKDRRQQYLDIANIMLLSLDVDGVVKLINPKGCKILGYHEDEIVGKNWYDTFLPERLREEVKVVAKKVFSREMESVRYYENFIINKLGEERLIAWNNAVFRNEYGEITGTLSSGEDITERKLAQEELKRHHDHLEDLVNERTKELEFKNSELDNMLKTFVGRELKIRNLQEEIILLKKK